MGIIPFMGAVRAGAPLTAVGIAVSCAENDNCVVHHKVADRSSRTHGLSAPREHIGFSDCPPKKTVLGSPPPRSG